MKQNVVEQNNDFEEDDREVKEPEEEIKQNKKEIEYQIKANDIEKKNYRTKRFINVINTGRDFGNFPINR